MRHFIITKQIDFVLLILGLIIFNGCEKTNDYDKGTVSFGVNTHVINCIATGEVYIDNKSIGIIPGFCDSLVDCQSINSLNKDISVGNHSFKIVVKGELGSCFRVKEGDFKLGKGECKKIFMDLTKIDN